MFSLSHSLPFLYAFSLSLSLSLYIYTYHLLGCVFSCNESYHYY